jgi:DNA-binding XRE family transcriptional regulator
MMKPPCNVTQLIHRRVSFRIRGRRLQVGMTQQQLAQIIGVAFQQGDKYENGLSRVSADCLSNCDSTGHSTRLFFSRGRAHAGRGERHRAALEARDQ